MLKSVKEPGGFELRMQNERAQGFKPKERKDRKGDRAGVLGGTPSRARETHALPGGTADNAECRMENLEWAEADRGLRRGHRNNTRGRVRSPKNSDGSILIFMGGIVAGGV